MADTAIRALEGGALSYNGNPSKSTLIIHSVQRVRNTEFIDIKENLYKFPKMDLFERIGQILPIYSLGDPKYLYLISLSLASSQIQSKPD